MKNLAANKSSAQTNSSTPILRWLDLLRAGSRTADSDLAELYLEFPPTQGELIFTGACAYTCAHCIYPPNFAAKNRSLGHNQWSKIFDRLALELGVGTFVYGGRSVSAPGMETLRALRDTVPSALVGLIDNGVSFVPFRNELLALNLDWVDVSVDGTEDAHDKQRGKSGGFRETLAGIDWLVENGAAPKINVLSCLTTINAQSITSMIRQLSKRGLPNYFITPVAILSGVRPMEQLRIDGDLLSEFIDSLCVELPRFEDVWIEIVFSDAELLSSLLERSRRLPTRVSVERDCLLFDFSTPSSTGGSTNVFLMRYSPISLTGTREMIINTNGDVIVPKSVGFGAVPSDSVVGNLVEESPLDLHRDSVNRDAFSFYRRELAAERALLQRLLDLDIVDF